MRQGLKDAVIVAWQALGKTGVWWTGADRLQIAREARTARACALCRERKAALIPHAVAGTHASSTNLSPSAIEAIHRIVSDPGRLCEAWYRRTTSSDLGEEAYVELLSVVAITTAIDTFDRARVVPARTLPAAVPVTPSRRRPAGAK